MKYLDKVIDALFRQGTRESKLLAGRIIIAQQAETTRLWKLCLEKAVRNGTPWPRIDEDAETLEAMLRGEPL